MMKKTLTLCSIVLLASAAASHATTLQFESAPNSPIYPYNMSLNGSSTYIAMSCLNADRGLPNGSWNVVMYNLGTLTGTVDFGQTTATELDEQAFLDEFYSSSAGNHTVVINGVNVTLDNNDIQQTIWHIQDSSVSLDSLQKTLLADATSFIGSSLDNSTFLSAFDVYIPTTAPPKCGPDTEPQEFMQYTPPVVAPTPEPSSLTLLDSGILGAAGLFYKRIGREDEVQK
jgi:hypothetical protein